MDVFFAIEPAELLNLKVKCSLDDKLQNVIWDHDGEKARAELDAEQIERLMAITQADDQFHSIYWPLRGFWMSA